MSARSKASMVGAASLALLAFMSSVCGTARSEATDDYAICQQTDDIEKSISACTRIIDDKSVGSDDRALMHLRRGYDYSTNGNAERAVRDYSRSIELRPGNIFAYANRAVVYERIGDRNRALQDIRTARALDASQFAALVQSSPELMALSKLVDMPAVDVQATESDSQNTIYLDTKNGRITIRLRPDLAPKAASQLRTLTKRGFYNGIVFHRVIDGFMAQTGDPTGTGTGKSDLPNIPAEFSTESFKRGTVGMARSSDPDSANSQFFICFSDASYLNNKYTVVGQVTSGMNVVDKIKKGSSANNGSVSDPDKIVNMQLAAGAK